MSAPHIIRAIELLKAARDLIEACDDAQTTAVIYDDAHCDGSCLLGDIETFLIELGEEDPS